MRTRPWWRALSVLGALALVAVFFAVVVFAAPTPAQAAVSYSAEELAFLDLINQYRQDNGLDTLLLSDVMSDAGDKHASDMGNYRFFDHTTRGSDYFAVGSSPWDRLAACGYDYNTLMGENIAAGFASAQLVFQGWKDSPGHDANMRNPDFRVIGVSLRSVPGSPYGSYWVTDFGGAVDPSAHEPEGPAATTTTTALADDVSPPAVRIGAPAAGSRVRGSISIAVTATDDRGVACVEIWIDGLFAARDATAPYGFVWDTTQTAEGAHNVEARAFDAAGNQASAFQTVNVANLQTTTTTATTTTRPPTTTTTAPTTTTTTTGPSVTTTTARPTTTTTQRTTSTTEPSAAFTDVQPDDSYYREITTLATKAIIGGYADSSFRPDNQVTRGQFAKIIMLALGRHTDLVEDSTQAMFSDVPFEGQPYPFDFVQEAAALDIIKGYADGTFGPYDFITKAQLALMLVRAGGAALAPVPAGYTLPFIDVPDYAAGAIAVAYYNGLVSGATATAYDPYFAATRGQVAKMVYNLMERLRR
jgi:uncharacterized protein YkwD